MLALSFMILLDHAQQLPTPQREFRLPTISYEGGDRGKIPSFGPDSQNVAPSADATRWYFSRITAYNKVGFMSRADICLADLKKRTYTVLVTPEDLPADTGGSPILLAPTYIKREQVLLFSSFHSMSRSGMWMLKGSQVIWLGDAKEEVVAADSEDDTWLITSAYSAPQKGAPRTDVVKPFDPLHPEPPITLIRLRDLKVVNWEGPPESVPQFSRRFKTIRID